MAGERDITQFGGMIARTLQLWLGGLCPCGVQDGYGHRNDCPLRYILDTDIEQLEEEIVDTVKVGLLGRKPDSYDWRGQWLDANA